MESWGHGAWGGPDVIVEVQHFFIVVHVFLTAGPIICSHVGLDFDGAGNHRCGLARTYRFVVFRG